MSADRSFEYIASRYNFHKKSIFSIEGGADPSSGLHLPGLERRGNAAELGESGER